MFKELRYRTSITFGVAGLILAVCLSSFSLNQQGPKRVRADRKTNTQLAVQVIASRSLVKLPPAVPLAPDNCEPTENEVRLYANTVSAHKADMNFTWQVPVGRLIGKNREVTWNLSGVRAGTYTATVEASDRHKHTASGSITVTVVICPGWLPDPPPCPIVLVSCPSGVESKDSITFEATVTGGPTGIIPTYEWSLSAGKIISGQATPKVTVDVSGLSDESVTATVSVGGYDPKCATVASCAIQFRETNLQWPDFHEAMPQAKAAAMRALEIDDTLAEGHTSLALIMFRYDWNWVGAEAELRRAIDLNPNYATAHQLYGSFLLASERPEEALTQIMHARELDPLSMVVSRGLGTYYLFTRQYDKAIAEYHKTLALDPNAAVRGYLRLAYQEQGKFDERFKKLKKYLLPD